MKRVVVQYKVKPDQAERNAELIRAVYEELEQIQPDGFRYATMRLDDGVTFIHIAEKFENGPSPLPELAAFQRFRSGIENRCDEQPVAKTAEEIGSFRLFTSDSR
jgi:hypothetical protein